MAGAQRKCAVHRLCSVFTEALTGVGGGGWREGPWRRQAIWGRDDVTNTNKGCFTFSGRKTPKVPCPNFYKPESFSWAESQRTGVKQSSPRRIGRQKLFSEESPEAWVSPIRQILTENPGQLTCPSFLFLLLPCRGKPCLSYLSGLWRPAGRMPMVNLGELNTPHKHEGFALPKLGWSSGVITCSLTPQYKKETVTLISKGYFISQEST